MSEPDYSALTTEPEPTDGAALLDQVQAFITRFIALPSPAALVAVVCWVVHTHAVDVFESTPRLALLSPEPGSGKTRVLEVLDLLVPAPMHAVNATPAALFRSISDLDHRPTILFDEIDTVFGPKAKDNEEVRGLLNAGHRRGAVAYRCVGEGTKQTVVAFPAYCAVALAGLGDLPDTIMTRAVIIRMRRRAPSEIVEPFRHRLHRDAGHLLREEIAAWSAEIAESVGATFPELPEGITDRPADVWEPLVAIADAAGGQWPARARAACVELVKAAQSTDSGSLGVLLLHDLRIVFGTADKLSTEAILDKLHHLEDAPWNDLRGRALDSRGLAYRLKAYGVRSTKVKIGADSLRGYLATDLHDPFKRYLPAPNKAAQDDDEDNGPFPSSLSPELPEPAEHRRSTAPTAVPLADPVPEPPHQAEPHARRLTCAVPEVPQVPDLLQGEAGNPCSIHSKPTWQGICGRCAAEARAS